MTTRMRLLVLASTYPRWKGDPEPAFVHELSRRLVDRFEVTVLCPHAPGAATFEVLDGVSVVRYRYAPSRLETLVNNGGIMTNLRRTPWKWLLVPGFIAAQAFAAWHLLRSLRPKVVHAHWLLPQGLIVAILGLVFRWMPPLVVTSHGADLFAIRFPIIQTLKRFVVDHAARLTVVSEAMRGAVTRIGADLAKVDVEPMGVDLAVRFTPDPSVVRSRDEILFVGRLVEKKGLRYLIDAMPAVVARHPGAFLTVVGFGPEEAERRAQVARLGLTDQVQFLGAMPQDRLPEFYRRAAVFVAPFVEAASGDQEGLGLVAIEAAGCGCPVIVSRLPGALDVLAAAPMVRGVPPGESVALKDALLDMLSADVIVSAREAIMPFDWGPRSAAYASLLSSVGRLS